ncbi:CCN family member 2-like [Mya arenaria]|uniref:CCN family member 2-like n=1 Tax=Mya arenaria TaxID=6604 RepID=UPI0022E30A4B|nr:CCN family member 2-like [Mya arenaria]
MVSFIILALVVILASARPQTACNYKGTHYYQDDVWTDGCRYNCSCIDASIGYYRCRDLCPTYTNLPPGCTIEKQSGDCCGHPTCQDYVVDNHRPMIICGRGMRALHLQPNPHGFRRCSRV